jgi:hypothetical protein
MGTLLSTLATLLVLFVSMPSNIAGAQVFQWTDPKGVLHVTDNPHSIPESVRNSSLLIVRRDWHSQSGPAAKSSDPLPALVQSNQTDESETYAMPTPPPVITYAPQELNIVVVNRARPHKKNPCRAVAECRSVFRPDFTNRRYIHPSVFDGGSRQYIHP